MQALKATQAREINKAEITEAETLVFEGRVLGQTGKQAMEPGEFYFRPTMVPVTTTPGWFTKLLGAKPVNEFKIIQTIVMACPPYCSTPIMTTSGHKIEHRTERRTLPRLRRPLLFRTPLDWRHHRLCFRGQAGSHRHHGLQVIARGVLLPVRSGGRLRHRDFRERHI
jgi:hypothetical protein